MHIQTPFQRSGVINYFHWLRRTYQFAAFEILTSKYWVCRENGKQLKRQMNAHALRNVSGWYRTEYWCSATLLSLEIWSNTNANGTVCCLANLLHCWLTSHTHPGPVSLTSLQGQAGGPFLFLASPPVPSTPTLPDKSLAQWINAFMLWRHKGYLLISYSMQ